MKKMSKQVVKRFFGMVLVVVMLAGLLPGQVWAAEAFATTPMVSGGGLHTAALRDDGTVWTWGQNNNGQLGDGTITDSHTPVQVQGLNNITAVSASANHYTIALRYDGTVWSWGRNDRGQLGDGTTTRRLTPVQVQGLNNVTAVSAGDNHAIALRNDGTVWAWGYNWYGQLGDGTIIEHYTPLQVQGLNNITAVSASERHTVALREDGTVWAWGDNLGGQLGDGTTTARHTPVQVQGLNNVTAVSAGDRHTIALRNDGTVWAWGGNYEGQLGDGTTTNRHTPVQVQGLNNIIAVSAGWDHTVALRNDGTVWAWGQNGWGQLGDGTTINLFTPVQAQGLNNATAVSAGSGAVALRDDGTVWAWGVNWFGQLGDGTTTQRLTPVQVVGENGIGFLNLVGDAAFVIEYSMSEARPAGGQFEINVYIADSGLTFSDFSTNCMIQILMDFNSDVFTLTNFVAAPDFELDAIVFGDDPPSVWMYISQAVINAGGDFGGRVGTFIFDICDEVEVGDAFEFILDSTIWAVPLGFVELHGTTAVFDVIITDIDISDDFICPAFKQYLNQNHGVPATGAIYPSHVRNITQISASNRGITSLNGIQHFSNIENIVVQGNNLTELDLSGLHRLRHLNASNNNLTILDVTGATALEAISISRNNISTIIGLDTLENLEVFWAEGNVFASLNFHHVAPLEKIDVRGNAPPLSDSNITGWSAINLPDYDPTRIFLPRVWARLRILSGMAF